MEKHEDVILVLARIHAAAKLVAARPERGIEFGFLEGHPLVAPVLRHCDRRAGGAIINEMRVAVRDLAIDAADRKIHHFDFPQRTDGNGEHAVAKAQRSADCWIMCRLIADMEGG